MVAPWEIGRPRKHVAAVELLYRLRPWPRDLRLYRADQLYFYLETSGWIWLDEIGHWAPRMPRSAW